MAYQIICLKNRSFWNKIVLFVAFFIVVVYCVSLIMPDVQNEASTDGALYQQLEQELQSVNQSTHTDEAQG